MGLMRSKRAAKRSSIGLGLSRVIAGRGPAASRSEDDGWLESDDGFCGVRKAQYGGSDGRHRNLAEELEARLATALVQLW